MEGVLAPSVPLNRPLPHSHDSCLEKSRGKSFLLHVWVLGAMRERQTPVSRHRVCQQEEETTANTKGGKGIIAGGVQTPVLWLFDFFLLSRRRISWILDISPWHTVAGACQSCTLGG